MLTVGELIEELRKHDLSAIAVISICDEFGDVVPTPVGSVSVSTFAGGERVDGRYLFRTRPAVLITNE